MKILLTLVALFVAAPVSNGQTTYRIDSAESEITYSMDHPAHDWSGTSRRVSGNILVENGQVLRGRASAPVVSFDSGNRSRDSNMVSDAEAYIYPNVIFQAGAVTPQGDGLATVEGTLTFHGVSREVTVPVRVSMTAERVQLRGEFEVTLSEFEIARPSFMMVKTKDWIGLSFDLVTTR